MEKLNRHTVKDRPLRPERVLQFGGGNFLRGFVDWIIQHLNENTDFKGNVVIVKPTPGGEYKSLREQDGLFHTILSGSRNEKGFQDIKLIDCVSKIIHPYHEFEAFLNSAENPELNIIISNTTESGIIFREKDQEISSTASTFPGKLTQWLHRRFKVLGGGAISGCTILPCELIEDNASHLRAFILKYAELWQLGSQFSEWIEEHQHFCNTLVDRIVTGYPQEQADAIGEQIQYQDSLLVAGEDYHSWIIEGTEDLLQTLPFDQTSLHVQIVNDLQIHREIKVRILNGLHTAMVPVGYLNGQRTVREVMLDDRMSRYLNQLLATEILHTIDFDIDKLQSYAAAILDRFQNPAIEHQLKSIALNSISKFRTRLLPTLLAHYRSTDTIPPHTARALSALLLFYSGSWQGAELPVQDDPEIQQYFKAEWKNYSEGKQSLDKTVRAMLREKSYWHEDLTLLKDLQFVVIDTINSILQNDDVFA